MKTIVRRVISALFFLAAAIGIIFLVTPFFVDTYILPSLLEKITVNNKSASLSRITPFSTRGTLSVEDGDTPVASIPRFELSYTPGSLFNLKIASLTIDHATFHLVKKNNRFQMAGISSSSTRPSLHGSTPVAPLFFPAAIERLILKQCSVILHEPGRSDIRFTLSSRTDFSFNNKSSSGFALSSAEGSFLASDTVNARGTFSFITGPDEHALSVDLQSGLEQLPDDVIGRHTSIYGSMLLKASVLVGAKNLQIKNVQAAGTINKFQLNYKDAVVKGGQADSTITFSLSGSPQDLHYSLGTVSLETPIRLRTTLTGRGKISKNLLQAEGSLTNTIVSPFALNQEPLSIPLRYNVQFDTNASNWQVNLDGKYSSKNQRVLVHNDLSLLLPNFTLSSSIAGSQREFDGTIHFTGAPLALVRDDSRIEISDIDMGVELHSSIEQTSFQVTGFIPAINYPSADLMFEGVTFKLPYHFPFSPGEQQQPGQLTIESIESKGSPLLAVSATLLQREDSLDLTGTVRALFSDNMNLQLSGTVKQKPLQARLTWSVDHAPLSSTTLSSALQSTGSLDFNGSLTTSGNFLYDNHQLSGDALVNMDIASLQVPEQQVNLENISCTVHFANLPEIASLPSQKCSVALLEFGNLHFSDASVDFRIENPETVFIEKSSVKWCQGKLESTSLRLSRTNPEINTALYCSKINFSDLLNQFGLDQADGEGSLNGKLPIALSKDGLSFDDGFLFSTPGTGGIIRFSNTDMLRQGVGAADVGGYLDYSMKAMEDFAYQWTKLSFNSSGDELLLTMELNGKPRTPLPYAFKKGMIIETDKGEGLQYPIRLDVNFRLPLAELFQFGQNIQAIKENM